MSLKAFNAWFDYVGGWEGGYANRNPSEDPGGATNRGITWITYSFIAPKVGLNPTFNYFKYNLTKNDARKIAWYLWVNWFYGNAIKNDAVAVGIAYAFWGGHFGPMVEFVQKWLNKYTNANLSYTGMGTSTLKAINSLNESQSQKLVKDMTNFKYDFMRSLPNAAANPGWFRARPSYEELLNSLSGSTNTILIIGVALLAAGLIKKYSKIK